MIRDIALAIAFLTRIPIGGNLACNSRDIARAMRWFPLVGALVGTIEMGVAWAALRMFPPMVAAVLALAVEALLTGAMHFDGIADTADGFGGGRTREDVLRIMRDHSIGTYGALALVLVVALKAAAIAAMAGRGSLIPALVIAPALGRWTAVLASALEPYARPPEHDAAKGVGAPARYVGRAEVAVSTAIALGIAVALGRWVGAVAAALVAMFCVWWGKRCERRIGGVTGDTLGAGIQVSECLVLLLFTAMR